MTDKHQAADSGKEKALSKAKRKAETEAAFRAKRKARKHELIAIHNAAVDEANAGKPKATFEIGFKARRVRRDGKVENLPPEFSRILKACEELIDNKKRFPSLYAWGGDGINNIQCRTVLSRVLACLLTNSDLIGGRIGEPTESGIKPISYDQIQEDYALRFGKFLSPNSCANAIRNLKLAGYIQTARINVCVDELEGSVRSAPAYKQFTDVFFNDLKVSRYTNIADLILATRDRNEKKGLRYVWRSFRDLAGKVQEIYNASKLNELAEHTKTVFQSTTAVPTAIPY